MVTVFRLLDFLIPIAKSRLQDCPLHSRFCQQISTTINHRIIAYLELFIFSLGHEAISPDEETSMGLVQHEGGPCSVLAAIQIVARSLEGLSLESGCDVQKVLTVTTFTSPASAMQRLESMIPISRSRIGALLFLLSALLSRGLEINKFKDSFKGGMKLGIKPLATVEDSSPRRIPRISKKWLNPKQHSEDPE
ncbi:hypothetical protein LXL04_028856 [Taraxacum kok-saghyz]